MITFEDFKKVELKVGKILAVERVEGSEKLLKLSVDLGPSSVEATEGKEERDIRQILAGIGKSYNPEDLVGTNVSVVVNLEPRKMMGLESQGMLLAASDESGPVLLRPEKSVPPGSEIR